MARFSSAAFAGFAVASAILLAAPLRAANRTWAVSSGDWSTALNWQGGILPTGSDAVYIVNGGTATITMPGAFCSTLSLGSSAGSGTVQMTNGSPTATSSYEYVGGSGTGTFLQTAGTNNLGLLYVGNKIGGSGTYNLSGSGLMSASTEYVGYGGAGTYTQTGGTNTMTDTLCLGVAAGSGTYSLSGSGQLRANREYVGYSGTGTFTQSGGTNTMSDMLYLGYTAGNGTYNLKGNGQLSAESEFVGNSGVGTFTQSGGSNNIRENLYLGFNSGSSGTYSFGGSGVLVGASAFFFSEYVGYNSVGTFNQTGGTNNPATLYIGYNLGSSGSYNLTGSGALAGTFQTAEYVGYNSIGAFNQTGGTNNRGNLYIGYNLGSGGSYNLSGSGVLAGTAIGASEYVGYSGIGTFNQTGGTNNVTMGNFYLGYLAGSSGTYNLNGGVIFLSSLSKGKGTAAFNFSGGTIQAGSGFSTNMPMAIGASGNGATFNTNGFPVTLYGPLSGPGSLTKTGSGSLTLAASNSFSGNTLISAGTLALGNAMALQQSTLDTSGSGALSFGSLASATLGGLTGPGTLVLNNSTSAAVSLTAGNNDADTTYSGTLQGTGRLTKIGSGVLCLIGASTYTGPTTINQGELSVNGSLASPITVNTGGVLGGTGNLTSVTVNAGGQLAPGNSPGVLNLSGSLILSSGAVMDYDLDGLTTSDKISMPSGILSLNGQQFSDFNFTSLAGFGLGCYVLIDAGSINGSLGDNLSDMINGRDASIQLQGGDLVLNVVPEPSTLMLLGAGVLGLVGWARRQRRRLGFQPVVSRQVENLSYSD